MKRFYECEFTEDLFCEFCGYDYNYDLFYNPWCFVCGDIVTALVAVDRVFHLLAVLGGGRWDEAPLHLHPDFPVVVEIGAGKKIY